jgi:subtilisin family serine protease
MVEPNHVLRATVVPNDKLYSVQSAYLGLVQATSAWDIELGEDSVMVAVLDSGIDLVHPDLIGRFWTNPGEANDNNVDDDSNGCVDDKNGCSFVSAATVDDSCDEPSPQTVTDDNGHGTFVSGIIAAQGNNGLGISGVAPGVTIVPVKILDCRGGGTAVEAAQGILYAARIGARVANISFGAEGESITLANAIREAHERYGMVIIAATGNEGSSKVTFPARLPQIIAVASSGTPEDATARSPFSDWGPEVSFAAPGLNVVSTVPQAFCGEGWLCVEDLPYAVSSGTSFAAPIASGLAALLISNTPHLSPEAVRQIIVSTAQPLPDGSTPNWDGAGRIQMRDALVKPRFYLGAPGIGKH